MELETQVTATRPVVSAPLQTIERSPSAPSWHAVKTVTGKSTDCHIHAHNTRPAAAVPDSDSTETEQSGLRPVVGHRHRDRKPVGRGRGQGSGRQKIFCLPLSAFCFPRLPSAFCFPPSASFIKGARCAGSLDRAHRTRDRAVLPWV